MSQGLVRYGAQLNSIEDKKKLFAFSLKKGMLFSIIIAFCVLMLSSIITQKLPGSKIYLIVLSFQMISMFMFEITRFYTRIIHRNKVFSVIGVINYSLLFISTVISSYFFGTMG